MTTKIATSNFQQTALDTIGGGPKTATVTPTNSSWVATGGSTIATTGGYVTIAGSGFLAGCQVLVDTTPATAVTVVSSSLLQVQVPAKAAGTYPLYVVNTDGSFGLKPLGITYQ